MNRKQRCKIVCRGFMLILLILSLLPMYTLAQSPSVYIIPIKETIDPGLASFVERSLEEAEELEVNMVILEVNTPGGIIDSAVRIGDALSNTSLATTAFVKGEAISAGAYISLACEKIAMVPGSAIGDAEPRIGSERADEKFVSYWAGKMATTADKHGRDPEIARAMADRDVEIPNLVEKGKLLTLTYTQAKQYGYTDFIVDDREELLTVLGLTDARILEAKPTMAERITRIITNPYIAPIFLTIGIAGIIIEIFTIGWGIAGTIGIISLLLYFGGHLLAGFTGWEAIFLFLLGVILLGVEILIPGFGLPGIGGIISIFVSIVLAAPSWEVGISSLVIAIIGTIILVFLSFKILSKRKFWDRLTLNIKFNKEEGYISQSRDLSGYLGKKGTAYTPLRPAGTAVLDEDGTRLDVVTDGEFIPRGESIEVARVEGIRVIVRLAPKEIK